MTAGPRDAVAAGGPPEITGDFLSGAAEVEYVRTQMWGAYWTGARLLLGAWLMGVGCFVFAYLYLRNLDSESDWRVAHQYPSLTMGSIILGLVVVSALTNLLSSHRLRSAAAALDWVVGAGIALALGLVAAGLQMWQLARLPFQPGRSGYASLFVGWEPVMALGFLGAMYWLETLIARALRVRRLLRPIAISERDPDVTMFRGSLDGFGVFWGTVALTEVGVFVLFYIVH